SVRPTTRTAVCRWTPHPARTTATTCHPPPNPHLRGEATVTAAQPARPTTDRILSQLGVATGHGGDPGRPAATGEALPWDADPLPLSAARLRPPFPVAALPGWVGDMVAAVAEASQTPPDLPGCVALACLATAAGGRAVVNVHNDWTEPVNLYLAV